MTELSHLCISVKVSVEMQTPKLLWLKKNKPEIWDHAQDFFDLADFLTFKVIFLSGKVIFQGQKYSVILNKRAARLFILRNFPTYTLLLGTYMFINFHKIFCPHAHYIGLKGGF